MWEIQLFLGPCRPWLVVLGLLWSWQKAFTIAPVRVPQFGDGFRLAFRAVPKVRMVDALEVDAVAAVDGAGARYRLVGCPVPAPGAPQDLARDPQPDRAAGGLLGVVGGAFALIPFPPQHQ